jgi:hypothetical protein
VPQKLPWDLACSPIEGNLKAPFWENDPMKKVDIFDFFHFHIRRAPKYPEESFIYRISKKNLGAQ